ncbi:MAG: hypothetical protein QOE89_794, partial [Pseudonocardiales bacterium]|nr:hypothetical protein [Pseudonocardiales bacterium]
MDADPPLTVLPAWEVAPLEDEPVLPVTEVAVGVVVVGVVVVGVVVVGVVVVGGQLLPEEELCPAEVAVEVVVEAVAATDEDT